MRKSSSKAWKNVWKNKPRLTVSDAALDIIAKGPIYGARPLKRAIQNIGGRFAGILPTCPSPLQSDGRKAA
nr:hypothetical protein [Neisseria meningitidis]